MYCARCGNEVGVRDLRCAVCDADLDASGALRLTDPCLDPHFKPVVAADESLAVVGETVENQDDAEGGELAAQVQEASEGDERSGEDVTAPREGEGASESGDGTDSLDETGVEGEAKGAAGDAEAQQGDSESDQAENATYDGEGETEDNVEVTQGDAEAEDAETVDSETADNADNEETSWQTKLAEQVSDRVDDLKGGVAKLNDAFNEPKNLRRLAKALGYDTERVPPAKVMGALAVLALTIVVMVVLMGQFMNIDKVLLPQIIHSPSAAVSASANQSPSNEPQPEGGSQTPAMVEGAKECDDGVWAGPQTSCPLANAVGEKIDRKLTGETDITVVSPDTQREYTLHCVAGQGISCQVADGSDGILVWLVA